jgi:hypothetical protein
VEFDVGLPESFLVTSYQPTHRRMCLPDALEMLVLSVERCQVGRRSLDDHAEHHQLMES